MKVFDSEAKSSAQHAVSRTSGTRWAEALRGACILLVEDHPLNQELEMEILSDAGMIITLAENGQEALEILDRQAFDGVLMDIQMPVMDGYAATRKIRSQSRFADLPVIAMTANAMVGDRQKALDAGMNDHIAKPLDIEHALRVMAESIRPSAEESASSAEVGTQPAASMSLPGVDTAAGLQVAMGRIDLYKRLVNRFAKSECNFTDRFGAAIADNDMDAALRHAHSLKSVAGNIGANDLSAAAAQLEQACAEGAAKDCVDAAFKDTSTHLDVVLEGFSDAAERATRPEYESIHVASEELFSILDKLLRENDASAVECAHKIAQQTFGPEREKAIVKLVNLVEAYEFDAALDALKIVRDVDH
jgi:CheY-like chemotaxis protein